MPSFAIDISSAQKERKTGVEWYAYHLVEALKRQALGEGERLAFFSRETLRWPLPFGWMKLRVTWEMLRRRPDALLVPAQGLPFAGRCAAVVHDVGFRRVPEVYAPADARRQRAEMRRVARRARLVFAVSEFTKREIVELYGVLPERVLVAPNAVDRDTFRPIDAHEAEVVRQKHRVGRHYFLYVGRMDAKKNVKTLVRAFELFKSARGVGDPFELVLVGPPGFGFEEIRGYVEHSTARESIRYFGYLPGNETAALMSGATAFAFPSWYEGFGVPPLEAAACGAPLVVSDIGAHREVLGDGALFVRPGEPEAWSRALTRMVLEPAFAADLRAKGEARVGMYSWDKTAGIILEGLRGIV